MLVTSCSRKDTSSAPETGAADPVGVAVEVMRLQTLRSTINASGTVVPATSADWTIYAPENGRIDELPKAEGADVKVGDVLVKFDYGNIAADVTAREGDVASATARLTAAQTALARVQSVFDRGAASKAELDTAKGAVASVEVDVARAKQQLQVAKDTLEKATIKARFAGVVAKRYHNEGDLVSASPTDPVLRVVDPQRVQVSASIAIKDIAQVQPGQAVTVLSPSGVEPATVATRPAPEDPTATMQDMRFAFVGPTTLTLDTPVQIEILLAERTGIIAVPNAAILRSADGAPYVMVASDGRAHRKDVHVGLVGKDRTEIMSGLNAGERVIVKDAAGIVEGTLVLADR